MKPVEKVPVTILTGFLGSGKTTLLNRILTETHGKRIAVIENEFGQIGIDHALVINADEEIFEMSNGCICCTVRGDLIRVLGNLMKRRNKFDYVLVETTGMADPGPVAQTFFMDADIQEEFSLDGIVTLVDAKHVFQQLGRSKESEEQIAFADVILLNKTDLVDSDEVDRIEARIRDMNRLARIHRSQHADVPVAHVLELGAFDLERALVKKPTFLEPEYPFEWTGVFDLEPGRYAVELDEGPDPTMSLVLVREARADDQGLRDAAEWCVRRYAEDPVVLSPGEEIPVGIHACLRVSGTGKKLFPFVCPDGGRVALYTQHTADEFDLLVRPLRGGEGGVGVDVGRPVAPLVEREWVPEHEHDDEVGSVAIEVEGDVDGTRLNRWLGAFLAERGVDIFRMKGFISLAGEPRRYVFQGVHMLFDGQPQRPWGDDPRRNQLVFIGRNLDGDEIREAFSACLV